MVIALNDRGNSRVCPDAGIGAVGHGMQRFAQPFNAFEQLVLRIGDKADSKLLGTGGICIESFTGHKRDPRFCRFMQQLAGKNAMAKCAPKIKAACRQGKGEVWAAVPSKGAGDKIAALFVFDADKGQVVIKQICC